MSALRRAVVTGGAGFLGSHVVGRLLDTGWDVTVVDNLAKGTKARTQTIADRDHFRFIEADIAGEHIRDVMSAASPDVVYHLAAHHFIPYCTAHPAETLRVNVLGTQRILDAIATA